MEDELEATYKQILSHFDKETKGLEYNVCITELNDGRKAMVSLRVEVL